MKKKMCRFTTMKGALIIAIVVLAMLSACSKGSGSGDDNHGGGPQGGSPTDTTAPMLDVFTPTANQVFTSGNAINVTGRITDDLGLYRGNIRIKDDATGNILKEQSYEIHYVLSYNFNISYIPTVTTPSDYTVTVFFEDHSYLSASKSVKIKVNP